MSTGYKLTVQGDDKDVILRYEVLNEFNTKASITFTGVELKDFIDEIVGHMKATYEHD